MIFVLSIILFLLLAFIGGKRGIKTYVSLYMNLFLLLLLLLFVSWGLHPILSTLIICICVSIVILLFLNKINVKTISSFISVFIVLLLLILFVSLFSNRAHIAGYTEETIDAVGHLEYNTGLDMLSLAKGIMILGLIGSIIDCSIAISSALYEVYSNNPELKIKELIQSGMNIGKDILGTTTNTLFFAYLGSYMTVLLYFYDFGYEWTMILNSKVFAIEYIRILLSATGCYLIIPITSIITALAIKKGEVYEKIRYHL